MVLVAGEMLDPGGCVVARIKRERGLKDVPGLRLDIVRGAPHGDEAGAVARVVQIMFREYLFRREEAGQRLHHEYRQAGLLFLQLDDSAAIDGNGVGLRESVE